MASKETTPQAQHYTTLYNINNPITVRFNQNQNKPPERTIIVALDMSKAFDTVNIQTRTHQRPQSIHHNQKHNINTTPIQNYCSTRRRPITHTFQHIHI